MINRLILCAIFMLLAGPVLSQTRIAHQQEVSGTWRLANSPYYVEGEALVPEGATLTIEPGVQVYFKAVDYDNDPDFEATNAKYFLETLGVGMLHVKGTLKAMGTAESPILFTRQGNGPGYWGSIALAGSATTSTMKHCVVEHANMVGYEFSGGVSVSNRPAMLEYVEVRQCAGIGIRLNQYDGGATELAYCIVHHNRDVGIYKHAWGGLTIDHCTITNQPYFGVQVESSDARVKVTNSLITYHEWPYYKDAGKENLTLENCLLTPHVVHPDYERISHPSNSNNKDPMYQDTAAGDFRLRPESPVAMADANGHPWGALGVVGQPSRGGAGGSGTASTIATSYNLGTYHALLVGVNQYQDQDIADLAHPISDVQRINQLLTSQYTFTPSHVRVLENPSRNSLLKALNEYKNTLTANDALLIFYAGHGYYNTANKQGYWWPSDAEKGAPYTWVSNSDIRDFIRAMPARHVLLISDACFSGGIFSGRGVAEELAEIEELVARKSRRAMTSGAQNEEVPDQSVFVEYFISKLQENQDLVLDSQSLFSKMRLPIVRNSNTTPADGFIKDAGDEGGDFVFIRKQ